MANETTIKNKKKMLEELEQSLGVVTAACRRANLSRAQHYFWLNEDTEYKKAVNELQDISLDFAETSLLNQIKDKNTSATIFYLKTKGRNRGYVERHEITGADNEPIIVKIIHGNKD